VRSDSNQNFSSCRNASLTKLVFLRTMAQQPQWTKGSSLHSDTRQWVGLLWTSDQP